MTIEINESDAATYLSKRGCLAWVHVSRPSLACKLSAETLGLPPNFDQLASPPTVKPPGVGYSNFTTLEQRARNAVNHRALSKGEVKFVPFRLVEKMVAEFESARDEYLGYAEVYLSRYPQAVADGLERWRAEAQRIYRPEMGVSPEAFVQKIVSAVAGAWPTEDKIRARFGMRLKVLQFSLPGISTDTAIDAGMLPDHIRKLASESLTSFHADLVHELRERTLEMSESMLKSLDGPRFTEKSVGALRNFIGRIRDLNVVDDAHVEASVKALETALGSRTAEDFRENPTWKNSFRDAVINVVQDGQRALAEAETAANQMLADRFGFGKRRLG